MQAEPFSGHAVPAPGGAGTAREVFMQWLFSRPQKHGIHVHENGEWRFHPYAAIAATSHRLAGVLRRQAGDGAARIPVGVLSDHAPTVLATFGAAWLLADAAHVLPQPLTFRHWDDYSRQVQYSLKLAGCRYVVFGGDSEKFAAELGDSLGSSVTFIDIQAAAENGASTADSWYDQASNPGSGGGNVAIHQFTSGSTGSPQLIEVSAANLAANLEGMRRWLGWQDGRDAWASWLPLHHDMGLVGGLLVPAARRSDLWSIPPGEFMRDPACWLEALTAGRATVTAAPTFGYSYAARRVTSLPAAVRLSEWRVACVGAEVVTQAVLGGFASRFGPYGFSARAWCPAYGLAEATLCVTAVLPDEQTRVAIIAEGAALRVGVPVEPLAIGRADDETTGQARTLVGCGRPILGTSVDIIDELGNCLPDGYFGEIVVRGPGVARVRQSAQADACPAGRAGADATAAAGEPPRENRPVSSYRTGDAGIKLGGELFVVGRLGNGVKVRGDFVDCESLEQRMAAALALPAERVALAVGQIGAEISAVLIVRAPAPSGDARARALAVARAVLGPGVHLLVVETDRGEIPRTSSGKVKRAEIWRRWADPPAAVDTPDKLEGSA